MSPPPETRWAVTTKSNLPGAKRMSERRARPIFPSRAKQWTHHSVRGQAEDWTNHVEIPWPACLSCVRAWRVRNVSIVESCSDTAIKRKAWRSRGMRRLRRTEPSAGKAICSRLIAHDPIYLAISRLLLCACSPLSQPHAPWPPTSLPWSSGTIARFELVKCYFALLLAGVHVSEHAVSAVGTRSLRALPTAKPAACVTTVPQSTLVVLDLMLAFCGVQFLRTGDLSAAFAGSWRSDRSLSQGSFDMNIDDWCLFYNSWIQWEESRPRSYRAQLRKYFL